MTSIDPLFDEAQVAQLTGRGIATLQKDRVRGTGPKYVKLGRHVRYRPADIEAWISERVRQSTSGGPPWNSIPRSARLSPSSAET
jgi:predicted DNA-binding transcriptional regulator AlpA